MDNTEKTDLHILRIVEAEPEISQRQLAERLGVSLGKANYLLKALLDKGHIKAGNFMRAENKLKYAYLLTPEGITAKLQLTRAYITRKEQEFIALQTELATMRAELDRQAKTSQVTLEEYRCARPNFPLLELPRGRD